MPITPAARSAACSTHHQKSKLAAGPITDIVGGGPPIRDIEMSNGWDESATAWIDDIGERGDYSREYVLDTPMLERVRIGRYTRALDVGCGEGRFCRMLSDLGISAVGIDPTQAFINHAKNADPGGDYRVGRAESLAFSDGAFDLVVSYLTLIDIPDIERAIAEMVRVLRPQGSLLIANLNSFSTAGKWTDAPERQRRFQMDRYLEERGEWQSWRGIKIKNWHRPLSRYMALLLDQGMQLQHFAEPAALNGNAAQAEHYNRVPYFLIMEWQKPDNADNED